MRLLLITIFLVGSASAQQNDAQIIDAISAQNALYEKGYAERNVDMLVSLHTGDVLVLPPNRPNYIGHAGVRKMVEEDFAMTKEYILDLETRSLEVLGDTVIETGFYSATLQLEDGAVINDEGNTMVIWKRQADGSWLMQKDIFNSTLPLVSE